MKTCNLLISISILSGLLCTSSVNAQWQKTNIPSAERVNAFAISGTNIFAGTDSGGVFLSTDNGNTWTGTGLKNLRITSLAVSGTNIFAGAGYAGVFLSSNNGNTWGLANNGLTYTWNNLTWTRHIYSLLISGTNIFAGTDSGVFLSSNNGGLWTGLNKNLPPFGGYNVGGVYSLAISGTNIFAGTGGGIYLSTNNGGYWTNAGGNGLPPNYYYYSLATIGTNIFAVPSSRGVYLSTDNGNNWTAVNKGLSDTAVLALAVSGTTIFAGTESGVYLSSNNGSSWIALNNGFPNNTRVNSLAISGGILFAGTYGAVWKLSLNSISNVISGNVFNDVNKNCKKDSGEKTVKNSIVKMISDKQISYYTTPNNNGYYSAYADSGSTYTLSLVNPNSYWKTVCPSTPNTYTVKFSTINDTSANNDFGEQPRIYCPLMWVDVSTTAFLIRPGRKNTYTVNYCNKGTVDAANSYIKIEFDSAMIPLSSSLAWSAKKGNTYTFNLGTIAAEQCGTFYITDSVSSYVKMGSTLCTKAKIYPDTICTATDSSWDKSSISLTKACMNDSIVRFVIYNTGQSMTGTSEYRIYTNNGLSLTKKFQLAGGDSLIVDIIANGNTIRLEADQRTGHPGNSHPSETVEGCGHNQAGSRMIGLVNSVPQDDADEFVAIDCQTVRASYDPNEKLVVPTGITANNYISAKNELEYQIGFQNTGNDTAFLVVVRDTLPASLEVTSVVSGSSSHPYSFRIYGQGILEWTFKNILLVDSTTNEPKSHGFVKYRIKQKANNPKGTVIANRAAIYFDYNTPVITNAATNTVYDTTFVNTKDTIIILGNTNTNTFTAEANIAIYPNPTSNIFTLAVETTSKEDVTIKVYNLLGETVYTASEKVSGKYSKEINLHRPSGIYFVQVQCGERAYYRKLVVQ